MLMLDNSFFLSTRGPALLAPLSSQWSHRVRKESKEKIILLDSQLRPLLRETWAAILRNVSFK